MSKRTVTRLFAGSLIAFAAGAVVAIAAVWLAIANNVFVMAGADVVGVEGGGLAWSLLGLAIVGGVAIVAAFVAGLVAWIGALLNTWQLESKTWFAVLLLTGIFNFGFIAMIVYVLAGPDSRPAATSHGLHAAAPA
jgi:hypothetical protein